MKTASIYISLMMLLLLGGCGSDVNVQSFETDMQCFRTLAGVECLGDGIQCHQRRGMDRLSCRVTIITKEGKRQETPINPLNNHKVITWD